MRAQSLLLRNNTAAMMRMLQERLRHEALERELRLARDIQMGMLRRADPWFPERSEFGISALIKPAKLVGGDFYDGFLLDKDHLVLAIGDVAGKGISAALFMVRALTLLRSPAAHWISLQQTLESANRQLAEDNDLDMFLSVFMAVMDLRTGGIEFINFGHPPPVVRLADGSVAFLECKPGTLFGLMPDAEGAAGNLTLPPGATLILYSDGVTEAEARDEEQFGNHRLIQAIAAADTPDAGVIVRSIAAGVRRHAGEAEQSDDITLLAVTYHGQA
jgi:sigma-B regulation protein RsbU (phosphoserine phosphatase)